MKEKGHHVAVLSPHQDDALISVGTTILEAFDHRTILDIFTRSQSTILPIPEEYENITLLRSTEERAMGEKYNIEIYEAGFSESEIRGISWDDVMAPIDNRLITEVAEWIAEGIGSMRGVNSVFIPAVFGLHPDHYTVLLAYQHKALRSVLATKYLSLYADQPYYVDNGSTHGGHIVLEKIPPTLHPISYLMKREMLSCYPSQLSNERVERLARFQYELMWPIAGDDLSRFTKLAMLRGQNGRTKVFGSVEWLSSIEKTYAMPNHAFVSCKIENGDGISLDIPLRFEIMDVANIGLVRVARFAGAGVSDYFTFSQEAEFDTHAYMQLKDYLKTQGIQVIWFSNVIRGSSIDLVMSQQKEIQSLDSIDSVGLICSINYETWLNSQSKNMQRNIRRKIEFLEAEAQGIGETVIFDIHPLSLDSLQTMLNNQEKRAREMGYDIFKHNPEYVKFLTELVGKEKMLLSELKIGAEVLASLFFILDPDRKTIAFYMQSFNPNWSHFSPSFCAIIKLIEYAHDNGYTYIDFLRGEEDYKKHFTNHRIRLHKYVDLLDPSINGTELVHLISQIQE